jgi:hypothetical protein
MCGRVVEGFRGDDNLFSPRKFLQRPADYLFAGPI